MSPNRDRPSSESSATLRALIQWKHKRGQVAESIVLARLASRIAAQERVPKRPDELSRMTMARYLAVMPGDKEVRQALRQIGAPRPGLSFQRFLAWAMFVGCGLAAALWIHVHGLPLLPEPPAPAPVPHTVVRPVRPPVAAVAPVEDATPVVIRAVGDIVLGSDFPVHRLPSAKDRQRIASLRHEFGSADIVVGNLEGVLHDKGKPRKDTSRPGVFAFRMPQSYAAILREMGFHVLSLANNHSLDFGRSGLQTTLQALRAEGVQPVGVPGAEMAIVKVRSTSVAFLNYSYLPAFARLDDEARIEADIRRARAAADLVVVTVHGGREGADAAGAPTGDEYYRGEYRGDLRKFARLSIDAGASAVFGHGPHVVRPYEIYREKPIFYSLGNFVGYGALSTRGKLASSIIAEVRFSPKGKLLGTGVIPLKLDAAGIPSVDYSAGTLDTLDGLLEEQLDKRPVLELASRPGV